MAVGCGPQGGSIRLSDDAYTWRKVAEGPLETYSNLAEEAGRFLAGRRRPKCSDDGVNLADAGFTGTVANNARRVRVMGSPPFFAVVAQDSVGPEWVLSRDRGRSWQTATLPCGGAMAWEGGMAIGNGVSVVVDGNGTTCRSVDNGQTWVAGAMGGIPDTDLHFDGQKSRLWGTAGAARVMFSSTDAVTWATQSLTLRLPSGATATPVPLGPVARTSSGAWVSTAGTGSRVYSAQLFFRSADGIHWEQLPPSNYVASPRIRRMVAGTVPAGTVCP